jgi:hypothetical protein
MALRKADSLRAAIRPILDTTDALLPSHSMAMAFCRVYASNAGHLLYCGVPNESVRRSWRHG